ARNCGTALCSTKLRLPPFRTLDNPDGVCRTEKRLQSAPIFWSCLPCPVNTCFSERDTGIKKDMLAVSFSSFVKQEKEDFPRQYRVVKNARFLSAILVKEKTGLFCYSAFLSQTEVF